MNKSNFEAHYNESPVSSETELEKLRISSFDDLYETLRGQDLEVIAELTENIENPDKRNMAGLIALIEEVKDGILPIEALVETHDLRKIVALLIDKNSNLIKTEIQDIDVSPDNTEFDDLGIHNFDELYTTLDGQPEDVMNDLTHNIESDSGVKTDQLKNIIEDVRAGLLPIESITNKHDLRRIVMSLMQRDKVMMATKLSDYEKSPNPKEDTQDEDTDQNNNERVVDGVEDESDQVNMEDYLNISNFDDLYETLRGQDPEVINELLDNVDIENGGKKDKEHLIELVEGVRHGIYPINALVEKHSLRKIVQNLLKIDGEKQIKNSLPTQENIRIPIVVNAFKSLKKKAAIFASNFFSFFK